MKVARSALHISLSLRERVGVRETIKAAPIALRDSLSPWERAEVRGTVLAPATIVLWGGAAAMTVRQLTRNNVPGSRRIFVRIQGVKTGA